MVAVETQSENEAKIFVKPSFKQLTVEVNSSVWDKMQTLSMAQDFLKNSFIDIKFTYHAIHRLKVAIQWFLVCSQSCVTITTINFEHFHLPKKKPHTHS